MIKIHLREHSTHKAGYSFDEHFDLDNYTSADEIIQELMEQTKNTIIENGLNVNDFSPLKEWLITDLEIDSDYLNCNDIGFDEHMSIDKLLKINETLNGDKYFHEDNDLVIKLYMETSGSNIEEALEKVNKGDLSIIELRRCAYKTEIQILGEGLIENAEECGLDIPDYLIHYIDEEKFGRDFGTGYYTVHTFKNGKIYAIRAD